MLETGLGGRPHIVRVAESAADEVEVVLREAGFEAVPAETASEALDLARGPPGDHRPR